MNNWGDSLIMSEPDSLHIIALAKVHLVIYWLTALYTYKHSTQWADNPIINARETGWQLV